MRVLLVDDDPITAAYLREVLAGCAALSVATRLADADPNGFDALIVDRRLPDGDGWRWLAAQAPPPAGAVRISGDREVGALQKPLQPEALLAALGIVPDVDDDMAARNLGANPAAIAQLREMLRAELGTAQICMDSLTDIGPDDIDAVHRFAAAARLVGMPRLAAAAQRLESAWRASQPTEAALLAFRRAARAVSS
jgi:CheY-like chemotaxis protein